MTQFKTSKNSVHDVYFYDLYSTGKLQQRCGIFVKFFCNRTKFTYETGENDTYLNLISRVNCANFQASS